MSSLPAPRMRVSQRLPLACIECTRRKVKCDKKVPCSRCARLQKHCAREVVQVRKDTAIRREELDFLQQLYKVVTSGREPSEIEKLLRGRLESIGNETEPVLGHSQSSDGHSMAKTAIQDIRTVESQIWSRQSSLCYPHRGQCGCHQRRSYSEMASINANVDDLELRWSSVPLSVACLPTGELARELVQFHIEQLAWHHNVLHCPTFWRQCEIFWSTGMVVHPFWLALYISVMNATLWTVINSPGHTEAVVLNEKLLRNGFMDVNIILQHQELNRLLYEYRFLENASLFAIQAIVIATRYAHNIGFSDSLGNILYSMYGIAQTMGLHRIPSSDLDGSAALQENSQVWFEKIEREVGKRTWWQLVIQDHFSIPFTETYAINKLHYSTALPLNCNDDNMVARQDNTFTSSSYTRSVASEALLMPTLLDSLGAVDSRRPINETYRHVLHTDSKMRKVITTLSHLLNSSEAKHYRWLSTAIRTLAISAADKVIMIHRPMLGFAFKHPEFDHTRQICVAAAATIFREHELASVDNSGILSMWTQSAFCTTATIVIGMELLYRPNENAETRDRYRQSMRAAATRLQRRRQDTMAAKCALMIEALLEAERNLGSNADAQHHPNREEQIAKVFRDHLVNSGWSNAVFTPSTQALFPDIPTSQDFAPWYDDLFGL